MRRLIAILGGGDWVDASVNFLSLPTNINLRNAKAEYEQWYSKWSKQKRSILWPAPLKEEYLSFSQWLGKNCDAQLATEAEIEVFNEDDL